MDNRRLKHTDKKSEDKQITIFKEIPGKVKLEMALDLTRIAIELIKIGIRQRHSDDSDIEVDNTIRKIILGADLYEKIYHKC